MECTVARLFRYVADNATRYKKHLLEENINDDLDMDYSLYSDISRYITDCGWDKSFAKWSHEVLPDGLTHTMITTTAFKLPEKYINGYGDVNIIPHTHYLIEMYRIPLEQPPTLNNLLLIAYNYGLLRPFLRAKNFQRNIRAPFKARTAQRMENFIACTERTELSTKVPTEILSHVRKIIAENKMW